MFYKRLSLIKLFLLINTVFVCNLGHASSFGDISDLLAQEYEQIIMESVQAYDDNITMGKTQQAIDGSATENDSGVISTVLTSLPTGTYGSLSFSSDGSFTYTLYPDSTVVLDLEPGESLEERFTYKIVGTNNYESSADIIINILGNLSAETDAASEIDGFYAMDDLNYITKNVNEGTSEVTGDILANDSGYKTAKFTQSSNDLNPDNPYIGKYGSLAYIADGCADGCASYTYTLFNSIQAVQELNFDQSLNDEIFTYQLTHESGATVEATLTIIIFGAQGSITDDVEIESNNSSSEATTILTSNANYVKEMKGHLHSSDDKDWFKITGQDEVIHIELCPSGSSCFDENAWVLYVFDGSSLTTEMEETPYPLTLTGDDTGEILWTSSSNHLYLKYNAGAFDDCLVGIIDPCFGETYGVDIAFGSAEKTYYVVISSPLARNSEKDGPEDSCSDGGSVLLERSGSMRSYAYANGEDEQGNDIIEIKEETTTQTGIAIFPNSDDQYVFSVTRTGVNPIKDDSIPAAQLNIGKSALLIPRLRINNDLYSVELSFLDEGNSKSNRTSKSNDNILKFSIADIQKLDEPVADHPYAATFNPDTNEVKIAKYIDNDTQDLYSLTLFYYPASSPQEPWLELTNYELIK